MSKPPLELTIYERHPGDGQPVYRVGGSFTPYAIVGKDKRFTDAELAAEYQNSRLVSYVRHRRVENCPGDKVLFDHYDRALEQEWFLERFATFPHHDEATE